MKKHVLNGCIHIHSNFSYDGIYSVAELASIARYRGLSFICITDHSDLLDEEKTALLVDACKAASTADFIAIPGIEFSCADNLHLLAIGIKALKMSTDPIEVARGVLRDGGLAIVAHPSRNSYRMPDGLKEIINGIEVWNISYDGRYVPNPDAMELYNLISAERKADNFFAFCGHDMHKNVSIIDKLAIRVTDTELSQESILDSLREGRFTFRSNWISMAAGKPFRRSNILAFRFMQSIYRIAKKANEAVKKLPQR